MDFLCPGCGNLHRQLDADLQKMVDAGQINLDLHFMAFMDRWSTDEYSSRAANAAIYLAEHDSDPNHLISFLEKVYAEDFQPEEGSAYKSVSDAKIKEQMIAAGVSKDVADKRLAAIIRNGLMRSTLTRRSVPNCGISPAATRAA